MNRASAPLAGPRPPLSRRLAYPMTRDLALLGMGVAMLVTLMVTTQNWIGLAGTDRPRSWMYLFIREVPVWYIWLALSPAIFALGRRFPLLGRRWPQNVAVHLVASAVFVMVAITVFYVVIWPLFSVDRPGIGYFEAVWRSYRTRFAIFMIIYFTILALHQALDHYREAQRKSLREAQLETMLERSRRDLLRMQLHPHFLFNTLHAVSALMDRDTVAARRMITRLSDLLRLSLENDAQHEVTLEEEMEFLEKYLEIQRIRFGDKRFTLQHQTPAAKHLRM